MDVVLGVGLNLEEGVTLERSSLRVWKLKEYVFIFGTGENGQATINLNILLGNKKRRHAEVPSL